MQIREGAYYRTRGDDKNPGVVFGPMQFSAISNCWRVPGWSWTVSGQRYSNHEDEMDLITEVYVSARSAGRKEMSDIVERLRSADVLIDKSATDLRSVVAEEAAAEIEKLREALGLTVMLFKQIMDAIEADPVETVLIARNQGTEVKRITVQECFDKARAVLGEKK